MRNLSNTGAENSDKAMAYIKKQCKSLNIQVSYTLSGNKKGFDGLIVYHGGRRKSKGSYAAKSYLIVLRYNIP